MSTENTFICDCCGARHVGSRLPSGWQAGVDITLEAEGLPAYSPWCISETLKHLCGPCMGAVASAINAVLKVEEKSE